MDTVSETKQLLRTIRICLIAFIVGLVLSGLTAFPLQAEIDCLANTMGAAPGQTGLWGWIETVRTGIDSIAAQQPWFFYGTDWLAFGHIVISLFFFGPLRDPVRNVFVLRTGVVACVLVWPLALICGPLRGIPGYWRLIDCMFGVIGAIPLLIAIKAVRKLEELGAQGS